MSSPAAAPDPRLVAAARDFDAGAFWEAHEGFEHAWAESGGEERRVLQALVQLAAGYHKLELGVHGGAVKLLTRALGTLGDVRSAAAPFVEVRRVVERQLAALRASADPMPLDAPRLGDLFRP